MVECPLVTVIMPVYNSEQFVAEAIDSILAQSLTDFELIIINDGSTDKSEDIILGFADKRIVYIKNPHNLQLVSTLNKGLALARGKYIARMDSDDIAMPERFQTQVRFLEENPQVGVCGSNVSLFGVWNFETDVSNSSKDINAEMLLKNPVFHPTVMFRRNLIEETGIHYNSSFVHLEDYFFWAELSEVTQIVNLKEVLLKYRWHEENISNTKRTIQYDRASEVIAYKIRKILSPQKFTAEQVDIISKLLYIPDERKKKISKKDFLLVLKAFNDIYLNFESNAISKPVLLKFSERVKKIILDNRYRNASTLYFILTSPVLKISFMGKIKLLLKMLPFRSSNL